VDNVLTLTPESDVRVLEVLINKHIVFL
jgi:hypothetical protein